MNFIDMNLTPEIKTIDCKINDDITLNVKQFLPTEDKVKFIEFVVNGALDEETGCFSPIRTEVYYEIALCRFYADIEFSEEDLEHITTVCDILETNHVIDSIERCLYLDEINYMRDLVDKTVEDIARYNSSAAGIIRSMSTDASGLGDQITEILGQIKNAEGIEQLSVIKDVVGTD